MIEKFKNMFFYLVFDAYGRSAKPGIWFLRLFLPCFNVGSNIAFFAVLFAVSFNGQTKPK